MNSSDMFGNIIFPFSAPFAVPDPFAGCLFSQPAFSFPVPVPLWSPPISSCHKVAPSIVKPPGKKVCEHGKQRHICRQCGGKSICEHGVQKQQCTTCGGKSVCVHHRVRSQCVDCGGASICLHGKRKSRCRDCGGSAICNHGRIKYGCKECKGSKICLHNKFKTSCSACLKLRDQNAAKILSKARSGDSDTDTDDEGILLLADRSGSSVVHKKN